MESRPLEKLQQRATDAGLDLHTSDFAKLMDESDGLKDMRGEFVDPIVINPSKVPDTRERGVHLAANKLGLPAKKAKGLIAEVMNNWATNAVESHFSEPLPAATCEEYVVKQMLTLVGANDRNEVAAMNDVEMNLHLMLVSFYRPDADRYKILVDREGGYHNIPLSHVVRRGCRTEDALLFPAQDSGEIRTKHFLELIESEGESISCVLLPSVLSKSGCLLDHEMIARTAHENGCTVGFIISDAVGVVELQLHKWLVDFACWDSGKYLGAGPNALGCAFLHSKHAHHSHPILTGWWSHRFSSRFLMNNVLDRSPGITGYKISNQSPIKIAQLKAVLDIYDGTTVKAIREKSIMLNRYFEYLLNNRLGELSSLRDKIKIITPGMRTERAAQISLRMATNAQEMCKLLGNFGMFCSFVCPDILIICLHPLYCGFQDVFAFVWELISQMQRLTEQ